ncbi:MAG TPA: PQQ-binding-like beta-propeller repeat protein, partial [Acidimicrobiia bacterium]|nr:PQQ-binding-like beta-propeller repeat protein [Acidimicrobiia bacterium]
MPRFLNTVAMLCRRALLAAGLVGGLGLLWGQSAGGAASVDLGWPSYGHDASNSRTNTTSGGLTRNRVGKLIPSWRKDGIVGVVGTPTVAAGVAYFADLTGTVWAVDAATGRVRWRSRVAAGTVGATAISGASLYVASGNTLYALDRRTGTIRWQTVTNTSSFAQISASPVVVGRLVFVGTASF